jgi:hypothetical protein
MLSIGVLVKPAKTGDAFWSDADISSRGEDVPSSISSGTKEQSQYSFSTNRHNEKKANYINPDSFFIGDADGADRELAEV